MYQLPLMALPSLLRRSLPQAVPVKAIDLAQLCIAADTLARLTADVGQFLSWLACSDTPEWTRVAGAACTAHSQHTVRNIKYTKRQPKRHVIHEPCQDQIGMVHALSATRDLDSLDKPRC
jgi:hypothetical protein